MRYRASILGAAIRALAVFGLVLGAGASAAQAQEKREARKVDPEADRILRSMSSYLSGLKSFTADYDVDNEVISEDGQKLQFSSSGSIAVQRPARLHATRRGGFADAELFFDGRTITLLGKNQNAYFQLNGPATLDEMIETIRSQVGLDLAGADLLYASPYEGLMTHVESGTYLGPAVVDGIACDHLAFRTDKVDWQLWVQRGDKPLPLKYVITTKWTTGAPQYTVRLHDWELQPRLDARRFEFRPPAGFKRVETLTPNEVGELHVGEQP
ncbi:DUF2092 domain-containing protein [Myxococcus sp. RHSTA-1-4]|uniref:DUF2092 domain-containing protein n=1 Tax=Myxococcus sp. RHSTA-1-4 TaxID=2874601 RepID=UPI001CBC4476|nr:DUF2092 domain-containing protein [Myxococcus sp. RHSTA-1-4]MBZ4416556.1 DUF2092 domain-containing protein [Myxococcus sp. RHSTA-1-4]